MQTTNYDKKLASLKRKSPVKPSKPRSRPVKILLPAAPMLVAVPCNNPWKDTYIRQQVERFIGSPPPALDSSDKLIVAYDAPGVRVGWRRVVGRLDDYLTVNWRAGVHENDRMGELNVPALWIDRELWMSYAPAEIQSQWVPLQMAKGQVAVGGLGMGYYALAAASRPEVTKVYVFEKDHRVVAMFDALYANPGPLRSACEKIRIVLGDVRKELPKYKPDGGLPWDLVYMDPYLSQCCKEAAKDVIDFWASGLVDTKAYRFWGQEAVTFHITSQMQRRPPTAMTSYHDGRFFRMLLTDPNTLKPHGSFSDDRYAEIIMEAFSARKVGY